MKLQYKELEQYSAAKKWSPSRRFLFQNKCFQMTFSIKCWAKFIVFVSKNDRTKFETKNTCGMTKCTYHSAINSAFLYFFDGLAFSLSSK